MKNKMISIQISFRPWAVILALLVVPACSFAAMYNESSGVATRRGNPSPSADASNVNEYTFQDEQINIDPDTGVVRVLRSDQKNLINDYVVDVIPVENVNVRELRNLMRQVTGAEGGRAEVIRDKEKGEYFVQVICPRFQLPYIRAAIAMLDEEWITALDDGAGEAYYVGKFRDIRAVDEIAARYAGEGESDLDLANNAVYRWDEPYRVEKYVESGAAAADIPINQVLLDVKVYEINVTNDKKLGLDYVAWKNGAGRNLAGFVLAGMDNHERFTNLSSIYNPIFPRVINPGSQDLRLVREFTADATYGYANYLLTAAYLDFLTVKGKAKVLASTKILARSGQGRNAGSEPARFEAVDDIVAIVAEPNDDGVLEGLGARTRRLETPSGELRLTSMASGNPTFDQWGNPAFDYDTDLVETDVPIHDRTLELRMEGKVGIFLEMIPHVSLEACELEIATGVSSVAGYAPNGLPILAQRTMFTQVVAPNSQPVVIGGLKRETGIKNNQRMPVLGKIPVAGYLFGGETDAKRETQVAVVITPTIVSRADSQVTMSAEDRSTIAATDPGADLDPPRNPMGFDQWLLDREQPLP